MTHEKFMSNLNQLIEDFDRLKETYERRRAEDIRLFGNSNQLDADMMAFLRYYSETLESLKS